MRVTCLICLILKYISLPLVVVHLTYLFKFHICHAKQPHLQSAGYTPAMGVLCGRDPLRLAPPMEDLPPFQTELKAIPLPNLLSLYRHPQSLNPVYNF